MNILTDLKQYQSTVDSSTPVEMPFKVDEIVELVLGFENPKSWPSITPSVVENDLTRLVFGNVPVKFTEHHGASPAYYPNLDLIRLLPKSDYLYSPDTNYLHSVMHELSHASGHRSRLNRTMGSRGTSLSEYSFEELVAEQCAAMLMDRFGLYEETRDMHAKYVARHLYHGQFDDKMLALERAADEAQKAYEFMTRRNY